MRRILRFHGLRLLAALTLSGALACSLVVDFEPEGKPCDEAEACLEGYVCEEGICIVEPPPPDAGDAGLPEGDAGLLDLFDAGLEDLPDAGVPPEDAGEEL